MKNALRIIGIILLAVVVLAGLLLLYLSRRPAVPKDYISKTETAGEIETRYLQKGAYEVSYLEANAMQSFQKYEFYYPSEMTDSEKRYPVVIFSNGTGVTGSKYSAVLEHLASWGFIVVATEEEYSWNGFSSEMCLRHLIWLNETEQVEGWENNPFYQHVDLEKIGASGHSQGGVGVINAAVNTEHGAMYRAIFSASPTNQELAQALEWSYDPTEIRVPILLVSSTGDGDENLVVSLDGLQKIYDAVPDTTPKVMMRRSGADHGDMLYYADGYMTAWFMWQLQGDESAAAAFCGDDAEIRRNPLYQDIQTNLQ